jgi:hypothetical protein
MSKGCSGKEYFMSYPTECTRCIYSCPHNQYLSSLCDGSGTDPFLSYKCKECTCPDGLPPEKECTNMLLNHECRNCKGVDCMPSTALAQQTTAALRRTTSTEAQIQTTTTPAPVTNEEGVASWIWVVGSILLAVCLPTTALCCCCRRVGRGIPRKGGRRN